ncbi:MAG: TerC/Alx family metal homeostasis membrane protein [Sandaracinaceae bacterium]
MIWGSFVALVAFLLVLDLAVFHRRPAVLSLRRAALWSAFWVALGIAFALPVYWLYEHGPASGRIDGVDASTRYLTAFLLEKSLSVDNLFVIAAVFEAFRVRREHRRRVLYWGIVGAAVMRGVMITGGLFLLGRFTWLFPIFGLYLGYTGVQLLRSGEETGASPESGRVVRWLRAHLPIADFDGPRFLVREGGRLRFTLLAVVLLAVEWTDVVFALDSVPAVLAVTDDPFLAVSSNVFAILGLRSLFFVLEALIDRFARLKYALAVILLFVGGEMVLHGVVDVPNGVSLAVVAGLLTAGVLLSPGGVARAPRR